MLPCFPRKYRSEEDDSAPVDYLIFDSVAQGERERQSQPIHQPSAETRAAVKRTAYPRERSNAFARTPDYVPLSPKPLTAAQADYTDYWQSPQTPTGASAAYAAGEAGAAQRRRSARYTPAQFTAGFAPSAAAQPQTAPQPQTTTQPTAASVSPAAPISPAATPQPGTQAQNAPVFTAGDGEYTTPPAQEMPDWLRAARQNQTPYPVNRRTPQVQRAPQQPQAQSPALDPLGRPIRNAAPAQQQQPQNLSDAYVDAGYPPELVAQQRQREAEEALQRAYGNKRRGAQQPQYDRRAPAAPGTQEHSASYPPPRAEYARRQAQPDPATYAPPQAYRPQPMANPYAEPYHDSPYTVTAEKNDPRDRRMDEEPDENGEGGPKLKIPYLGIAVFALAGLAVLLWILQMSFVSREQAVLAARVDAQAALLSSHPYRYRELIEQQAQANNLHPAFVAAIVLNESSFNPSAESSVGARGLMQMMPDTAEWVHGKIDETTAYSFDLMYDPDTNVKYACWYLAYLSDLFNNDPVLVSAAFHAGQTTVKNWLSDSRYSTDSQSIDLSQMAEGPTKNYATRVLNAFAIYRRLYYEGGADSLQTAQESAQTTADIAAIAAVH